MDEEERDGGLAVVGADEFVGHAYEGKGGFMDGIHGDWIFEEVERRKSVLSSRKFAR
jgi:hypothetical protein